MSLVIMDTNPQVQQRVVLNPSHNRLTNHHLHRHDGRNIGCKVPEPVVMIRPPPPTSTPDGGSEEHDHDYQSPRSSQENGVCRRACSQEPVDRVRTAPMDDTALSVGLLASGLAWVQRSRERRRRQYLRHQAEQQLLKIALAELPRRHTALQDNPTFQQIAPGALTLEEEDAETFSRIGTPKTSKSGEGASAMLDLSFEDDEFLVPKVRVKQETTTAGNLIPYILTPSQMHQIAMHVLPKTIAYCQWRRLYGLGRDGDSFEGCLRIIQNVPRTLMVLRTTRGDVFGGFADGPWHSEEQGSARFYGGSQACLYTFKPRTDKVKVFKWTGKNRYIQLCDVTHKMLAFGGGGDDGAFGLCVQDDFQVGSTGPCDTFDNEPLCDQENFNIVDLEFWEFLTGEF